MKLQLRNLEKGDEIEARMATQDGYIWHPATITYIDADIMRVEYASGHPAIINRWDDETYQLPRLRRHG